MDPGSILVFTLHVSYFSASHADGYCQVIYRRSLHTIIEQLLSYQCKLNDFGFAFFRGLVANTVLNRCGTKTLPHTLSAATCFDLLAQDNSPGNMGHKDFFGMHFSQVLVIAH